MSTKEGLDGDIQEVGTIFQQVWPHSVCVSGVADASVPACSFHYAVYNRPQDY